MSARARVCVLCVCVSGREDREKKKIRLALTISGSDKLLTLDDRTITFPFSPLHSPFVLERLAPNNFGSVQGASG